MKREMLLHWIVVILCCFCVFGAIRIEDPSRSMGEKPMLIDSYGNLKFNDERARLDNFAAALQNEEATVKGYIIGYGGKGRGRKCEGLARGNRARLWLTETRGIKVGRLTIVDGGFRDEP